MGRRRGIRGTNAPPFATNVANLVHEYEGSLEGIVDLLIDWVSDTLPPDLLSPQLEVVVPQLVAAAGGKDRWERGCMGTTSVPKPRRSGLHPPSG